MTQPTGEPVQPEVREWIRDSWSLFYMESGRDPELAGINLLDEAELVFPDLSKQEIEAAFDEFQRGEEGRGACIRADREEAPAGHARLHQKPGAPQS